jgi:hypothetical protein
VSKKNKADILPLQGTANITLVIHNSVESNPQAQTDFHWSPGSQELLRKFQAQCYMDFGGKRASLVLDALVQQWLAGETTVRL